MTAWGVMNVDDGGVEIGGGGVVVDGGGGVLVDGIVEEA
jgi:hypothetical protein